MIKDTFFSLPRFMNLCRKEMVESWKSNVLRIVLLYGVMTVVWSGTDILHIVLTIRFVFSNVIWRPILPGDLY